MSDVRLPSTDFVELRESALAFLPAVLAYRAERHLPAQALVDKRVLLHKDERIGPEVVRKALAGFPVKYFKAAGTTSAFNLVMKENNEAISLSVQTIALAAFVFEDLGTVLKALHLSTATVAEKSGLTVAVIDSALEHYRLTFTAALGIVKALEQIARTRMFAGSKEDSIKALRNGHKFELIKTHPKIGRRSVKLIDDHNAGLVPVLGGDNIQPAPTRGHPWALEN